ncbi:MAG: iron-containing alcohol dehydrogenase, partial [Oscillospiraceae bacterium]|nr:iron-containing alcohol dehydrogenase [Oscillospiraceae bacterium]
MKSFDIRTKIYFGENSLERLQSLDCKLAMIISDPFVVKSGMIRYLTDRLEKGNIAYTVYDDVVPDPPVDKVTAGVRALLECGADLIIAVGGGSAID